MAGERIRGDLGHRMTDKALTAFMPKSGIFGGWEGDATDLGITEPRSMWRARMCRALEAAFNELLKDRPDDH